MKAHTLFFLAILLLPVLIVRGQTKMIALRSHSGRDADFKGSAPGDNFGNPGPRLEKITRISDTMVIFSMHYFFGENSFRFDTITKNGHSQNFHANNALFNSSVSADSLKKLYPGVEIVGFDTKPKHRKKSGSGLYFNGHDPFSGTNQVPALALMLILFCSGLGYAIWKNQEKKKRDLCLNAE